MSSRPDTSALLITILRYCPYLADLQTSLPIRGVEGVSTGLLAGLPGGPAWIYPAGTPPSLPPPPVAIHQLIQHYLGHDRLASYIGRDPAWHLALDTVVNRLIPPGLLPDTPRFHEPGGLAGVTGLLRIRQWWASHPEAVHPAWTSALEEHRFWSDRPGRHTYPKWPGEEPAEIPDPALAGACRETDDLVAGFHWPDRLFGSAIASPATRLTWTSRRPSRRYGTFPGIRVRQIPLLVIILDTSGSMADRDLKAVLAFLPSVRHRYRDLVLVQCDDRVRSVIRLSSLQEVPLSGGGDTVYQPAIDHVLRHFPGAPVWFITDGQGVPPRVPGSLDLTWLLCGDLPPEDRLKKFSGRLLRVNNPDPYPFV